MTTLHCGRENKDAEFEFKSVNGEVIAHCTTEGCEHFLKVGHHVTSEFMTAWIEEHRRANKPVLTAEKEAQIDADLNEMLEQFNV